VKAWAWPPAAAGTGIGDLGAQRHSTIDVLQPIFIAARPTAEIAAMLDDRFFDQIQQVIGVAHNGFPKRSYFPTFFAGRLCSRIVTMK
jgi:hypothetical protein